MLNELNTAKHSISILALENTFVNDLPPINRSRCWVILWAEFGANRRISAESQLFRLVLAVKIEMLCLTFVLLHFGHLTLVLPCSEMLWISVNFLLQPWHLYSYVGIPSSSPDNYFLDANSARTFFIVLMIQNILSSSWSCVGQFFLIKLVVVYTD